MESSTKNLLINIGAHCTFLGMMGILSIIIIGAFSYFTGLGQSFFYAALIGWSILALGASFFCLKCNCSYFMKKD